MIEEKKLRYVSLSLKHMEPAAVQRLVEKFEEAFERVGERASTIADIIAISEDTNTACSILQSNAAPPVDFRPNQTSIMKKVLRNEKIINPSALIREMLKPNSSPVLLKLFHYLDIKDIYFDEAYQFYFSHFLANESITPQMTEILKRWR